MKASLRFLLASLVAAIPTALCALAIEFVTCGHKASRDNIGRSKMISHIDHIVLTVTDVEKSVAFYKRVLKMNDIVFANGRRALRFGNQKINLQLLGEETRNNAAVGSGDLCLITEWSIQDIIQHLKNERIEILEGPILKSGATGQITSVWWESARFQAVCVAWS